LFVNLNPVNICLVTQACKPGDIAEVKASLPPGGSLSTPWPWEPGDTKKHHVMAMAVAKSN